MQNGPKPADSDGHILAREPTHWGTEWGIDKQSTTVVAVVECVCTLNRPNLLTKRIGPFVRMGRMTTGPGKLSQNATTQAAGPR